MNKLLFDNSFMLKIYLNRVEFLNIFDKFEENFFNMFK